MIVIYTKQVTNRIKYAFDFVFVNYFGIDYEIISDASHSKNADKFYLSYSTEKTENYFSIFQEELLLEDSIKLQKLFISKENDIPVFFQTDENFDIRFDLFAAIFYLITRHRKTHTCQTRQRTQQEILQGIDSQYLPTTGAQGA